MREFAEAMRKTDVKRCYLKLRFSGDARMGTAVQEYGKIAKGLLGLRVYMGLPMGTRFAWQMDEKALWWKTNSGAVFSSQTSISNWDYDRTWAMPDFIRDSGMKLEVIDREYDGQTFHLRVHFVKDDLPF